MSSKKARDHFFIVGTKDRFNMFHDVVVRTKDTKASHFLPALTSKRL